MIAFFFAGWPVSKVALVAGALLLVTRRVKPAGNLTVLGSVANLIVLERAPQSADRLLGVCARRGAADCANHRAGHFPAGETTGSSLTKL